MYKTRPENPLKPLPFPSPGVDWFQKKITGGTGFKTLRTATLQMIWLYTNLQQKLGNYLSHDSGSIVTKACSQTSCKGKVMFESNAKTCIDWTNFNFQFNDFSGNPMICYSKYHLLCYWPTMYYWIGHIFPSIVKNNEKTRASLEPFPNSIP